MQERPRNACELHSIPHLCVTVSCSWQLFHLMEFYVMERSFRAQISKVQYPSSLAYIYVCLFKASTRLVQFVVPLSQKESPWSSRCRNAKGAGMLTQIQLGGKQNGDV